MIDLNGFGVPVWGTTTTEPPVSDDELLAAFPFLRSINGNAVGGADSNSSPGNPWTDGAHPLPPGIKLRVE
jgi:hypothetical protein